MAGPDGAVVCSCEVAATFRRRFRGLMLREGLPAGSGLLLRPASSVHTCLMRFAIDVVFLDADLRVVRVAPAVRPWRLVLARGARAVLELPAGEAARHALEPGMQLTFDVACRP